MNLKLKYLTLIFVSISLFACTEILSEKSTQKKPDNLMIFVAPNGSDSAKGDLASPFATLPQAVTQSRKLRKSGYSKPITIYLREGTHQLTETLVLGLQDGRKNALTPQGNNKYGAGTAPAIPHLTIAAYPGENIVVSGGYSIKSWALASSNLTGLSDNAKGKVWVADMPDNIDTFNTLYNSKGMLNRARGQGFLPSKPGDKKTLHFPKGSLKNWKNVEDIEINIRPSKAWIINMLPLESVDEELGIAKTSVSATYNMSKLPPWVHGTKFATVWVENSLEALDQPGEWVVNTLTRKIYLWPSNPDQNGKPQKIIAPTTSELIRVEGKINYNKKTDIPVRGIAISGITFSHADRWAWKYEEKRLGWGLQHDWDMFDRPTAILRFRGAEDCEVSDNTFIHSGGSGIRFDLHAQRNKITNNELSYLGEAGILMVGYGAGTKDVNHHNDISNNHIHNFSQITWHSPGIWAWQSGHNRIANNYIHHSGYAAVLISNRIEPDRSLNGEGGRTLRRDEIPQSIVDSTKETYESWKVREQYNHSRHNLLEYNEITHSVQKLSDGNAIYISGAGTGNIVRYNYIHDNLEHSFPAAIRCDDDQHETTMHGNVLYNNYGFSAGIASKGVNDITNNFILGSLTAPKWGYISFEWVNVANSKVQNNIIISHPDGGNAHGERPIARTEDGDPLLVETNMEVNLYYHPTNPNWVDQHLVKLRAVDKEKNSLFSDPLFIDPANGNFGFKEGSPAIALGIEALDVSKMGRLTKTE
jgi:hypothetical protein